MALTFNTSLNKVALFYSKALKLKITNSSLKKAIEENPYYPSVLSLSETFTRYNIENSAYNLPTESFNELEAPFVAFVNMPAVGNDFVLVTAITERAVSYLYNNHKPQTIEKDEFINRFQNVVFFAEPNDDSGEADYEEQLKNERSAEVKKNVLITAAVLACLFIVAFNVIDTAINFSILIFVKIIGLATAILLLIYEIDNSNSFVKNICSAGAKTNCDAVLGSKASKMWGISWAEIGFFYFAGTTIMLLMPGLPLAYKTTWLAIANIFAAPYTLFSIYYQWRVVKQWCPLCLTIQVILLAELAWCILSFWVPAHSFSALFAGGITSFLMLAVAIISPIITWYGLKPVFIKAKDYSLFKGAYKRLQYHPDIFNSLLQQQPMAAKGWEQLGITIGNPAAHNTIIKVCSPYCGPCAKAHPQLEDVIKHNSNVNLKIIFTARNNPNDPNTKVVNHLMAVASQNNAAKTQLALDDWYLADTKTYETFAVKYPLNGELKQQDAKIEAMSLWCNKSEITHTPTIFINGHRLPENYNVEEIKYLF